MYVYEQYALVYVLENMDAIVLRMFQLFCWTRRKDICLRCTCTCSYVYVTVIVYLMRGVMVTDRSQRVCCVPVHDFIFDIVY